jgi:hypothetical protein
MNFLGWGKNDPNLRQGQKYMEYSLLYENDYKFNEPMENASPINNAPPLSKNERGFNVTLAEYTALHKELMAQNLASGSAATPTSSSLRDLQKKLVHYAQKINQNIRHQEVSDPILKQQLINQKQLLDQHIAQIQADNSTRQTLQGQEEDTQLVVISSQYHYIFFVIVLFILLIFLFRLITNSYIANTVYILLIVLVCLYYAII